MKTTSRRTLPVRGRAAALLCASLLLFAFLALPPPTAIAGPQELAWEDLVPEDERDRPLTYGDPNASLLREDLLLDEAKVSYGVVEALDGKEVRIPGFIVPLRSEPGKGVRTALLVPYMGACIHMPPPPPNQIVYIELAEPVRIEDIWRPYWLSGRLATEPFDSTLGSAAYTLAAEEIADYEW